MIVDYINKFSCSTTVNVHILFGTESMTRTMTSIFTCTIKVMHISCDTIKVRHAKSTCYISSHHHHQHHHHHHHHDHYHHHHGVMCTFDIFMTMSGTVATMH